jgi:hypothetical protein
MNVHMIARLTPLDMSADCTAGRERADGRRPSPKPQASTRGQFASGLIVIAAKD